MRNPAYRATVPGMTARELSTERERRALELFELAAKDDFRSELDSVLRAYGAEALAEALNKAVGTTCARCGFVLSEHCLLDSSADLPLVQADGRVRKDIKHWYTPQGKPDSVSVMGTLRKDPQSQVLYVLSAEGRRVRIWHRPLLDGGRVRVSSSYHGRVLQESGKTHVMLRFIGREPCLDWMSIEVQGGRDAEAE